jgi:hypothetical protein
MTNLQSQMAPVPSSSPARSPSPPRPLCLDAVKAPSSLPVSSSSSSSSRLSDVTTPAAVARQGQPMLSPGLANMIIPPPALSSLSLLTSTPSSLGFRNSASADFACTTEELLLASDAALAQVLLLLSLLHSQFSSVMTLSWFADAGRKRVSEGRRWIL